MANINNVNPDDKVGQPGQIDLDPKDRQSRKNDQDALYNQDEMNKGK